MTTPNPTTPSTVAASGTKKSKGQKVALTDFLSQDSTSWADLPIAPSSMDKSANATFGADQCSSSTIGSSGGYEEEQRQNPQRQPDFSKIPAGGPYVAFVGNFPYDTTENNLADFFDGINLKSVKIPFDHQSRRSKGHAYVEFGDEESLRLALTVSGHQFLGRNIRIDIAEPRERPQSSIEQQSTGSIFGIRDERGSGEGRRYGFGSATAERQSGFGGRGGKFEPAPPARSHYQAGDASDGFVRKTHESPVDNTPTNWRNSDVTCSVMPPANKPAQPTSRPPRPNPFGDAKPRDEFALMQKKKESS